MSIEKPETAKSVTQDETAPDLHIFSILNGSETTLPGQICKYDNDTIMNAYAHNIRAIYKLLPEQYRAEIAEEREEAARTLDFAREVMHSFFEHHGLAAEQIDHLNVLKRRHSLKMAAAREATLSNNIIPAGSMYEVAENGGLYAILSAFIVSFLTTLRSDHGLLMQCPVCKTLFVRDKDKPTQRYDCSTCSNRARQRNWYKKNSAASIEKAYPNVDNC